VTLAQLKPVPAVRAPIAHGGGLDAARRLYPQAPTPWLDLSTGVNPLPYPLPALAPEAFTRLPDANAVAETEAAAAKAYAAPPGVEVVAAAGSQAVIKSLPRLFPARRVGTLGFTYAEHAAAWRAAGAQPFEARALDELADAEVAVIVNPNNPDGRFCDPADIGFTAQRMARRGGLLVVDEAFMDFSPEASAVPYMGENLVVLRSFGKAYGLPGVRLGFALCRPPVAELLRAELGPWSVSGPALAVGAEALRDRDWLRRSATLLQSAAARLDARLDAAGLEIVGGTRLFRLVQSADAGFWFERLCRRGILTRRFAEKPHWLRFGLPGAPQEWERLAQALGVANG
jgi:cobalamin biosynthesis protein CobC